MNRERWEKLVDLFTTAREAGSQDREAILSQLAKTDPSLHRELEEMLAQDDSSEDPLPGLRRALPTPDLSVPHNKQIGRYRLLSRLGAGGMGVIYKAEDPTLKRTVAIKLLWTHAFEDSAAGDSVLREARAAAALQHPNICPIYEVNEFEGFHYIVMPALEGENLAQHLKSRGRLDAQSALAIAIQIANAMQAAHDKAIFHRDIKPANIYITPLTRGSVQVTLLDFGLAQGREISRQSHDGSIAGTLAYMSPEQTRGQPADAASDIWSFGVVIYEMLAGSKPFGDGPDGVTLHAIQNSPPIPLRSLVPEMSPAIVRIVQRTLEKDPRRRYATAGDLLEDLQACLEPSGGLAPVMPTVPRDRFQFRRWVAGAALLALFGLAGIFLLTRKHGTQVNVAPERDPLERITRTVSENRITSAAISPDGRQIAFTDLAGNLYRRDLKTSADRLVATLADQECKQISWADDSETMLLSLVSQSAGNLSVWIAPAGEPPKLAAANARDGAVAPDGGSIAYLNDAASEVWVRDLSTGTSRRIATDSARDSFLLVHWLGEGSLVAFVQRDRVPLQATSEELRDYRPPNYRWRYRIFDLAANVVRATTENVRMLFPTRLAGNRMAFLTWTDASTPMYSLEEVEVEPRRGTFRHLRAMPVSDRVLTISIDRAGANVAAVLGEWQNEIYTAEVNPANHDIRGIRRITFQNLNDFPHSWTADGKTIFFESERSGLYTLYRQSLTKGAAAKHLVDNPLGDVVPQLSPDGRWILFLRVKPKNPFIIARIPVEGGRAEVVPNVGAFDEFRCAKPGGKRCVMRSVVDGQFVFSELDPLRGRGRELTRCSWSRSLFGDWSLSMDGSQVAIPDHDRVPTVIRVFDLDDPGRGDYEVKLKDSTSLGAISWTAEGKGWFGGFFRASEKPTMRTDTGDLRYIDPKGRSKVLTRTSGSTFAVPTPDGKRIAFIDGVMSSNVWFGAFPEK